MSQPLLVFDKIASSQARTLDGLFWQRVSRSPDQLAYQAHDRVHGWQTSTWRALGQEVARWRHALAQAGLTSGDRIAILLRNGPTWVICEQASLALGLITVPLYIDDRPDNISLILQDASVKFLLIQDVGRWKKLASALEESLFPEHVLILENNPKIIELMLTDPRIINFTNWLPNFFPDLPLRQGDPHALASIVYTSGTTGRPKGVMLSHHNILSNTEAIFTLIPVYQNDLFLSVLPLSHMLERTGGYYLPMMAGASVAYSRAPAQFAEDLRKLRPTVLIAVPRVFERIAQKIRAHFTLGSVSSIWLLKFTVALGWRKFLRVQRHAGWHPGLLLWPLVKKFIAQRILETLGGRIRAAVSGGAALPADLAKTLLGLGLPVIQGYGLTETSPVISVNPLQDNRPTSAGVLLSGIAAQIGENDELLIKGENVMRGYWNNPAATAQVLSPEGWLNTGDQVKFQDGYLYIHGRIKDILVLSNGEKISPSDLENKLAQDPWIEQIIIVGEGRPFLIALLVLSAEGRHSLAQEQNLDPNALDNLDPEAMREIQQIILKQIKLILKDSPGYAKIRRVILSNEPWTLENGLLTPTLKIRRAQVLEYYQAKLDQVYAFTEE